ncbi:MAG: hypothetical protein RQ866_03745 [Bacteroidales bacterium]|nr:hypothetical protein [Bacteroidales bacterium]
MPTKAFIPNNTEIIFQLIDGEYILLNLTNGNYFSLDNIGVLIWDCVINAVPQDVFIDVIYECLPKKNIEIVKSVELVFAALLLEGLSMPCNTPSSDYENFIERIKKTISSDALALKPATLHAYKFIQEKYAHPCGVKKI